MTAPAISPLEDVARALERSALKREGSLARALGRDCSLAVEAELRWQIGELRRNAATVRDFDRRLADLCEQVTRLEKHHYDRKFRQVKHWDVIHVLTCGPDVPFPA